MFVNQTTGITRSIAVLWFILGLAFMLNEYTSGSLFFILGLCFLARTSPAGQQFANRNPRLATALIVLLTVLLLALVGILFVIQLI